ncbi:MAG: c-type cytochrome [Alphaproteobacteria bacterium]
MLKLAVKYGALCVIGIGCIASLSTVNAEDYGLGRTALPAEIAHWDIDIRPDGMGLPVGSGSANDGETLFEDNCASCHGDFGEGVDRWPVLAGGHDSLKSERPVKTIGSYWPYASTLFDYIYRAMPFGHSQSLTADEVYAISAYILVMNDVIDDWDLALDQDNFAQIEMPNVDNFYDDDRPDIPNLKDGAPCMQNCKAKVEITGRAMVLDVTPDEDVTAGMSVD